MDEPFESWPVMMRRIGAVRSSWEDMLRVDWSMGELEKAKWGIDSNVACVWMRRTFVVH
jgi:hypothetical protein